jgi:hypothetical protein
VAEPRAQITRLRGMTGMPSRIVAGIAAGIAAAALAGCGTAAGPAGLAEVTGPPGSFLTVTTSAGVTRGTSPSSLELVQYPVATLQLRSVRSGRGEAGVRHEREGRYPVGREDSMPGGSRNKAAQERFEAAGGKAAVVGKPVEEAETWCQEHGFPFVLVESRGASNLSWSPTRMRLTVDNGVVTDAHLG